MSDNRPTGHEEAHTGPIKNPKQLLLAVLFSFIVPIFAIIALVYYVVSDAKPAGSSDAGSMALGGMTQESRDKAVAARIQKVGMVEIRDANRELKAGLEVYTAQCAACHAATSTLTGSLRWRQATRQPAGHATAKHCARHAGRREHRRSCHADHRRGGRCGHARQSHGQRPERRVQWLEPALASDQRHVQRHRSRNSHLERRDLEQIPNGHIAD